MTAAAAPRSAASAPYGRPRSPVATVYVVAVLLAYIAALALQFIGRQAAPPWEVPGIADVTRWASALARFVPGVNGDAVVNPVLDVLVPAALIAPAGIRAVDFGLGRFRAGSARVAAAFLALSAAIVAAVLAFRLDVPAHVLQRLITNLTTNGFSEELLFRGMLLAALVPAVGAWRANVVQALAFAAVHLGLDLHLMHGNWPAAAGGAVVGQGTAALLFGWITLRTGNVVVASVLHDALDTLPI